MNSTMTCRIKMAKPPTAAQKRHLAKVREMACLTCGRYPASAHHVVSDGYKRLSKDHMRVCPLCPDCHQNGPNAVHKIGHRAFCELYGVDLLNVAKRMADGRWEAMDELIRLGQEMDDG